MLQFFMHELNFLKFSPYCTTLVQAVFEFELSSKPNNLPYKDYNEEYKFLTRIFYENEI